MNSIGGRDSPELLDVGAEDVSSTQFGEECSCDPELPQRAVLVEQLHGVEHLGLESGNQDDGMGR